MRRNGESRIIYARWRLAGGDKFKKPREVITEVSAD